MIDLYINIINGDILASVKNKRYEEALSVIETRLAANNISIDIESNLLLMKAYCNYQLQRYPLAINTINKILKYRYTNQIEQHILSQAFFLKAKIQMAHSKGENQEKNRSTFMAISSCMNLLNYRSETIELMDEFLEMIGKN